MSDSQYDDLFDNGDNPGTAPDESGESEGLKSLRKALEKANAELKKYRDKERSDEIETKIVGAGLPKEIANLRDVREAEDLDKWIEENKSWLPVGSNESDTTEVEETTETAEPHGKSAIPPDQVQQMQAFQNVQPGSFVPGSHDEIRAKVANAAEGVKSPEDFYAELGKMGALGDLS